MNTFVVFDSNKRKGNSFAIIQIRIGMLVCECYACKIFKQGKSREEKQNKKKETTWYYGNIVVVIRESCFGVFFFDCCCGKPNVNYPCTKHCVSDSVMWLRMIQWATISCTV